ncbi:aspartic peptidase domain-containing protein [Gilbertella persicaria]|uniref:aspartic peptidase domain-containing protein n=1 Tax=Gilbertella persicaria TaxID=101096 RepID=UPI00221F4956|nr:aspartic peptidase domain-containing protein [Gilbertella persicaria]KAI8081971.1 aspartic peptidase domain-containing protein [Gilbertella persicaria]
MKLFIIIVASLIAIANSQEEAKLIRLPIIQKRTQHELYKRDEFNTNVYNDNGSIYLVRIEVGTPPQTFELALDTGSADLWVPGSKCPSSFCPFAKFVESNSSTFKSLGQNFNITYGVGSASGLYAQDIITIGGATIQNQQFGIVNTTKNILTQLQTLTGESYTPTAGSTDNLTTYSQEHRMNGIFGLAYPLITASTQKEYMPFFFSLKEQQKISQHVFSIFLNSSDATGNAGQVIFGGIDTTKYKGALIYVPVSKTTKQGTQADYGYWQTYGQGLGVSSSGAKKLSLTFESTTNFVFDTGTTLTYLPTQVIEPLFEAAFGNHNLAYDANNNYFQVNCSLAQENITVQFMLSTSNQVSDNPVVLNVPISDLIFPLDANSMATASICMVGIVPTSKSIFLGQSVLRSFFQVYDIDQNRIGVASAVGSDSSVTSNSSNITTDTKVISSSTHVSCTHAFFIFSILLIILTL